MARALGVADRVVLLLSLVPYLREHGPTPVAELAAAFGTNDETIRRLVAFLGTAGVPGETHTYQPEDLFDIDWDAFEEHDVVSLTQIVAVEDTPRFSPAEHAALLAGLHMLGPLLPESERELATRTAAKLAAALPAPAGGPRAPTVSVTAEASDPRLAAILDATSRGVRLSFSYLDLQGAASRRTVEPFELTQLGHEWYLRAYCLDRRAERTFLLSGMRELQVLDAKAEHPPGRRAGSGAIGPEAAEMVGRIRLRASALHRIASFSPTVTGPAEPGWLTAEVALAHPAAAIRLVQAAPGDVVVEQPEEARRAVAAWVSRALAGYGE